MSEVDGATPVAVATTATQARRATGTQGYRRDGAPPAKAAVNAWLARLLAAASPASAPPRWALVLESTALSTLTALTARDAATGVSTTCVVVPNPDAAVCVAVRAAGALAFPVTSHALLAELVAGAGPMHAALVARGWAGAFDFVWLDYCGTFDSKAGRARKDDLARILAPPAAAAATAGDSSSVDGESDGAARVTVT